jgi:hypothetical protein
MLQEYNLYPIDSITQEATFTKLCKAIRAEYADVFQELKRLRSRRPHLDTGDFRIRLLPGFIPHIAYHIRDACLMR